MVCLVLVYALRLSILLICQRVISGGNIHVIKDADLSVKEPDTPDDESTGHGIPVPIKTSPCDARLRVMSFNTYHSGRHVIDGMIKMAKHILANDLDIVVLQEIEDDLVLPTLARLLGPEWSYRYRHPPRSFNIKPDMGIVTRHELLDTPAAKDEWSLNARIRIAYKDNTTEDVGVWCLHLNWECYGPYAACNRMVTRTEQIEAGEINANGRHPGRVQNINRIVDLDDFRRDLVADDLLLVAGDFNTPSHLDWVESTKHKHCGWSYEWPVTKMLANFGLQDAYRELHPDPSKEPGFTWSPIYKHQDYNGDTWGRSIPEPQARIDYVFYKKNRSRWRAERAYVYVGDQPVEYMPDHGSNDWPSDHASVIVEFVRSC